jgi:hypothetical protein
VINTPNPLYRADSFFTSLYIEASRGTGRVLVPSLSVLAAWRQVAGAGKHAASLRFTEHVPFSTAHAVDAMDWTVNAPPTAGRWAGRPVHAAELSNLLVGGHGAALVVPKVGLQAQAGVMVTAPAAGACGRPGRSA